ncbi:hypothetical protein ACEPAI_3038 [Sanghuangporus weigelae]
MDHYRNGGYPYREHRKSDEYRPRPEPGPGSEFVRSAYNGREVPVINGVPQWDAPLGPPLPEVRYARRTEREHISSHSRGHEPRFTYEHRAPPPPPPPPIQPVYTNAPPSFVDRPFINPGFGSPPPVPPPPVSGVRRTFTIRDPSPPPVPRVRRTFTIRDPSPPPVPRVRRTFTIREPTPPPTHSRPQYTSTAPSSGHRRRSPERHRSPDRYEYEERVHGASRKSWEANIPIRGSGHDSRRADPWDDLGAMRTHSPDPILPRERREHSPRRERTKSSSTRHPHRSRELSDSEHEYRRSAPRAKHQGHGPRDRPGSPIIVGRGSLFEKDMEEKERNRANEGPIVFPRNESSDDSEVYRRVRKTQKAKSSRDPYPEDRGSTRSKTARSTPKETRMPKPKTEPRSSRNDSIPTGNSGSRRADRTRHTGAQPSNVKVEYGELESMSDSNSNSGDLPPNWTSKSSPKEIIERCKKEAREAVDLCENKKKYRWMKTVWEKKRDEFDTIDKKGVGFVGEVKKKREAFLRDYKQRLLGEKVKWKGKGDDGEVAYLSGLITKVQGWEKTDVTE